MKPATLYACADCGKRECGEFTLRCTDCQEAFENITECPNCGLGVPIGEDADWPHICVNLND